MRKALVLLGLVSVGFAQVEVIDPMKDRKGFEVSLFVGVSDYKAEALKTSALVGFSVDSRVKYPFLVGGGVNVGWTSDLFVANPHTRFKARVPLMDRLKLDPYITAGVGYARNDKTDREKLMGQIGVGLSVLYFFPSLHVGLAVGANAYSDSRFNQFYVGGVVGF